MSNNYCIISICFFLFIFFLSILSFSHNFVYGIDQNQDIKMSVDTFCKRHSSRMSNNLLDGSFINAVFFHHGNCSVARTVWRPLNSNLFHDCGVITVFVVSIKEVFPVRWSLYEKTYKIFFFVH